jgi:glycosyltransferase involved in cell wall biosynthesis
MNTIRLALVGRPDRFTGPSKVMTALRDTLSRRDGLEIITIATRFACRGWGRVPRTEASSRSIDLPVLSPRAWFSTLRALGQSKAAIINVCDLAWYANIWVVFARLLGARVLYTAHGALRDEIALGTRTLPASGLMERILLMCADDYIAVSRLLASRLRYWYPRLREPIAVIQNGVDDAFLVRADPRPFLEKFRPQGDVVLFAGFFTKVKGVDVLLEAFRGITGTLVLAGWETSFFKPLKEAHAEMIAERRLLIAGPLDQTMLQSAYAAAKVFVMPSRQDSSPKAVIEAMAAGCPVVITDRVGTKEIMTDGVEGFVVPAGSPEALRGRLEFLLEHEETRETMGAAARRLATKHRWVVVAEKYFDAYARSTTR